MKLELHPHQQEAIEQMHNGCVLWGGVGTGKTIAALAYALLKEPGKKIVVVTTAKVRDSLDWEREAAKLNVDINQFEIDSWNKIGRFTEYENCFFIFDEQRLVGTGAWVKSFYKIAAKNRWVLLSATPGDTWSDYAPMFIANGWYKNITEFRREHAIYSRFTKYPKIERWINEGKLQKYRKQLLVHMPMARHTTRHIHHVECDYDKDTLELVRKKRWNIYKDEPIRNASELWNVMRKVVSVHPSRAEEIKKLMQKHPKLIIFYNFNYELDMLRELCSELEQSLNKEKLWVSKEPSVSSTTLATISHQMHQADLAVEHAKSVAPKKPVETQPGLILTNNSRSTEPSEQSPKLLLPRERYTTPSTRSQKSEESFSSEDSRSLNNSTMGSDDSVGSYFSWAEWNGHKHEALPVSPSWIYLVQYMSGSEGWNCTETDSMAFWSLTYSWKQWNQAMGRIDRLNTPFTDLHYYVLMTNSVAEKPVMAALDAKHDFQPR